MASTAILRQPNHIGLRSGSSLGVETEREDHLPLSFLVVANMDCALSVR